MARYGTSEDAAKQIYGRGDLGIRCTLLAHFPNGGFARFFEGFSLNDIAPQTIEELSALVTNSSLNDSLFEQCFEKKGIFENLSDEQYQSVLVAVSDNPRLSTPYDDSYLDGHAEYSYNKVFTDAWKLTAILPNTQRWAAVLYHLLYRCQSPVGFEPLPAINRWYFRPQNEADQDGAFFLRSRLADLLEPNDALLRATDAALRSSFYRRFQPTKYPRWDAFAASDQDYFLDSAIDNINLWRSDQARSVLSQLCWDHPDPHSDLSMPNRYRAVERRMQTQHPRWFEN